MSEIQSVIYPEGHVLHRSLTKKFPVIDRGDGLYLYDKSGKKYIDASGGALVMSLGHSNKELLEDYISEIRKITYVNGQQFTSEAMEQFAEKLVALAPKGLNKVAALSSGSEANEAAVKFARQLWVERGKGTKFKFIARNPGYHGNTLFSLSLSARPHYQKLFQPLLARVPMVEAPYEYRFKGDYQKDGATFYLKQLEDLILKEDPETIAGFILEPVSGSSTGASVPPENYLRGVAELCKKYEILTLADEVMCGSGRCGTFFASSAFGFEPDIAILGKGINSGLVPLSAVLVKQEHLDEMKKGSGYFMHAQTYAQVPSLASAGLCVLRYFEKHQVLESAKNLSMYFQSELRRRLLPLENVGSVQGMGMMAGVEFVKNKATKAPFDRAEKFAEKIVSKAFDAGVILWPNVGQVDGTHGDLVMLGPPLNITKSQVDEMVQALEKIFAA